MSDSFNSKLASYGKWTYRSAWALEITAALIGLSTGIVLGLQAFKNSESSVATDLLLASAPFFMVALAELTKIPIATLLFAAKWIWKPILAVFLVLLAGITFETVFMGLERSTTLRELQFKENQNKESELQRERERVISEVTVLQSHSPLADAQDNVDRLSKLANNEHQSIESQIAEIEKQLEGGSSLTPEGAQIRDELKALEEKRKALVDEQNLAVDTQSKQFASQRDSYVERLKNPDLTPEQRAKWTQELTSLKNPVPSIYSDYKRQLEPIDADIAAKRDKLAAIRASQVNGNSDQRNQAETRHKELTDKLRDSENNWASQIDKARQTMGDAQALEASRSKTIDDLNAKKFDLDKQIAEAENKRVILARQDQVQRLAGWVYGQNPEDVKIESAARIGVIWFGSLAGLAALAGPMSAIVALGLQKIGLSEPSPKTSGNLTKLLRSLVAGWRWKRIKKVNVEKEVTVEKVVKEFVYIPLLTDDPEAIFNSLGSQMPEEVIEKVKTSVRSKRNGNKAQHSGA